jgi:hypothetical protein
LASSTFSYSPAYRNIGFVTHRILSFASVHDTFLIYSNLLSLREGSHHPVQYFP